jgi:formate dehydrogenase subunit delta
MSGAEQHGAEGAEHLVRMANDIGNFFRSEPKRDDAVAGIANHIAKFWTPRMREKLLAHMRVHGSEGLDELPLAAVCSLSVGSMQKPRESHGGDAG